jgi:putative endonuclease
VTDASRARRASKRGRDGGNAATAGRRAAERRGLRAEGLAALWLTLKGYRVLARRVRTPAGEVDLIVRRGGAVVAVEVKARPDVGTAVDSVSPRQRRRVALGLESFLTGRSDLARLDRRFDLMVIRPWRLPLHLMDVWRPER